MFTAAAFSACPRTLRIAAAEGSAASATATAAAAAAAAAAADSAPGPAATAAASAAATAATTASFTGVDATGASTIVFVSGSTIHVAAPTVPPDCGAGTWTHSVLVGVVGRSGAGAPAGRPPSASAAAHRRAPLGTTAFEAATISARVPSTGVCTLAMAALSCSLVCRAAPW